MLTFNEHLEKLEQEKLNIDIEDGRPDPDLQEGLLRSGAVGVYAAKSRQDGDEAVKHYNQARDLLRRKSLRPHDAQCDEGLRQALEEMLVGLTHMRHQTGNALAANVAGHLLATGADPQGHKRRK